MFSLKSKLILLFGLLVAVVLITWLYVQQSYSELGVTVPDEGGMDEPRDLVTATQVIILSPTPSSTSTLAPTTTNPGPEGSNCTYPLVYWQQNQAQIPAQILVNISTDGLNEYCVNYAQSEICSRLGETNSAPDVSLRQQFLVAIMNYLSGADPSAIANTINDAYEWLRSNASSVSIDDAVAQTAERFADILRTFNEGEIGPGACDIDIIPITQSSTATQTPAIESPATATSSLPTISSTPTVRETVIVILPTATEEPEDNEPEPTWTSAPPTEPPPTNTPPSPTETEVPPPTPTPVPEIPTPTPVLEVPTPTPVP